MQKKVIQHFYLTFFPLEKTVLYRIELWKKHHGLYKKETTR